MKKVELLSPAGDLETLKVAVHCGADAIYISGKDYGARKFAKNFTIEEIEEATNYCHLYGVKLYITVNTLIEETDIEEVTNYVKKIHTIGVDALIMQDIGMISYLKQKFPNLEIHASTQTHNCSKECIDYLETLNVSRVVLARELTLNEIKQIKTPLELEVFIHGALCVSYSGQCLISSYLYNRSGNKGECSQVCRFKFDLYQNNKKHNIPNNYLLSMKELCTGETIKNLLDIGISSLKIEGRMKSKYYVGFVTKFYRTIIDKYYNNEELTITKEEYNKLLTLYNREFTTGYLNEDRNIVNPKTCNHQGIPTGEVLETKKKIKLKLTENLNQGDGLRFPNQEGMIVNFLYNEKGLLVNKIDKGSIAYIDNKINLKEKGKFYKTSDISLNKEIESLPKKKIPISFKVIAKKDKPLTITIEDNTNQITETSIIPEKSINKETTKEEIIEKLSKLGTTPFILEKIDINIDNDIFIPLTQINRLRQILTEKLINQRQKPIKNVIEKQIKESKKETTQTNEISFLVRNENQLKYLLTKNVNIYTEDYKLYQKYNKENIFYRNPRAAFTYKEAKNSLITNNGGLKVYKSKNIIDIYMNVKNSNTINEFQKYSYKIGLSPELKDDELEMLMTNYYKKYNNYPNVELLIYGNLELMLMKHCPINYALTKDRCKEVCNICQKNNFYLSNDNNHKYRLLKDENHTLRLLSNEKINNLKKIKEYQKTGITNFRIDLNDETENDLENILKELKRTND